MFRRVALLLLLIAVAIGCTGGLFSRTLGYGFDYDDYHFVRPFTSDEIASAFHGPWDVTRIEVPLYRPLTVAFFAARFELLGLNAVAHHALSLTLFVSCAVAFGLFAAALAGGRPLAGLLATVLFCVHPAMPYALVCWTTNQMHLLTALVVLVGFVWWTVVRGTGAFWWLPILCLGVTAFLIKEDGLILLPAIVVLQVQSRYLCPAGAAPLPKSYVGAAGVVFVGCVLFRWVVLEGFGGYGPPDLNTALTNLGKGLRSVFWLVPAHRAWQREASWFASVLPLAGFVLALRNGNRPAMLCVLAGVSLALLFNLPFAFVTKPEQYHLIALCASLAFLGGCLGIIDAFEPRSWRVVAVLMVLTGMAAMGAVSRHISTDFEPYGPIVLHHDAIVRGWAAVPRELRDYLARKGEPGAPDTLSSNPVDAVPIVTWGLLEREIDSNGVPYRWLGGKRGVVMVAADARTVEFPVRHLIEFTRAPVAVDLEADGRRADAVTLRDRQWHVLQTGLRRDAVRRWSKMHRLVLRVDRTWIPSQVIPESRDNRVFGVQVGEVRFR